MVTTSIRSGKQKWQVQVKVKTMENTYKVKLK